MLAGPMHLALSPANSSGLIWAGRNEDKNRSVDKRTRYFKGFNFFTEPPPKKIKDDRRHLIHFFDAIEKVFFQYGAKIIRARIAGYNKQEEAMHILNLSKSIEIVKENRAHLPIILHLVSQTLINASR
jgi:hypothetical protein